MHIHSLVGYGWCTLSLPSKGGLRRRRRRGCHWHRLPGVGTGVATRVASRVASGEASGEASWIASVVVASVVVASKAIVPWKIKSDN